MTSTLSDFLKWVKHCYGLSPVLTFTLFFVVSLMIFGLFRGLFLYWPAIYDSVMLLVMGSSWFSDKSVDSSNKGEKSADVVGDFVVDKSSSEKSMDVSGLADILKEAVKEAVKEAMKDLLAKEVSKKKEKVVSGDGTVVPKKKSKKALASEGESVSVSSKDQEVTPVKKKKKSPSVSKKETVPKETNSDL
nr:M-ORF [Cuneopsis celtiformis]